MTERMRKRYLDELGARLNKRSRRLFTSDVVQELSGHLDERVEDLLGDGRDLTEAIDIALDELGEVSDLADAFLLVHSEQRRKFMRFTLTTSATIAVIAIGCFLSWPANDQSAHQPATSAQESPSESSAEVDPFGRSQADVADPFAGNQPAKPTPRQKQPVAALQSTHNQLTSETEKKLQRTMQVELLGMSLAESLEYIQVESGTQFYVKWHRLEDIGIECSSSEINLTIEAPISTVLEFVLDQVDIGIQYAIRDGIVVVSTAEDLLSSTMSVRIYDCRDLVATNASGGGMMGGMGAMDIDMEFSLGGGGGAVGMPAGMGSGEKVIPPVATSESSMHLIRIVQNIVDTDSWSEFGGAGTIAEFNGLVIINQNDRTHRRVEDLLRMMREAEATRKGKTARH
jgi:hypothetical protein